VSRVQHALATDCRSCQSGGSRDQWERVDVLSVNTFIHGWLEGLETNSEQPNSLPSESPVPNLDLDAEEGNDNELLPNKRDYAKIVFESSAYLWLTSSIRRELALALLPSQENSCTSVYSEVIRYLDDERKAAVSSRRPSDRHLMRLTADWNVIAFLARQFSHSTAPYGDLVAQTITLTGSETDAQAVPCEMYVRQTWPVSGPCLLLLVKRALCSGGKGEGEHARWP
jgi:hypothetical protein